MNSVSKSGWIAIGRSGVRAAVFMSVVVACLANGGGTAVADTPQGRPSPGVAPSPRAEDLERFREFAQRLHRGEVPAEELGLRDPSAWYSARFPEPLAGRLATGTSPTNGFAAAAKEFDAKRTRVVAGLVSSMERARTERGLGADRIVVGRYSSSSTKAPVGVAAILRLMKKPTELYWFGYSIGNAEEGSGEVDPEVGFFVQEGADFRWLGTLEEIGLAMEESSFAPLELGAYAEGRDPIAGEWVFDEAWSLACSGLASAADFERIAGHDGQLVAFREIRFEFFGDGRFRTHAGERVEMDGLWKWWQFGRYTDVKEEAPESLEFLTSNDSSIMMVRGRLFFWLPIKEGVMWTAVFRRADSAQETAPSSDQSLALVGRWRVDGEAAARWSAQRRIAQGQPMNDELLSSMEDFSVGDFDFRPDGSVALYPDSQEKEALTLKWRMDGDVLFVSGEHELGGFVQGGKLFLLAEGHPEYKWSGPIPMRKVVPDENPRVRP